MHRFLSAAIILLFMSFAMFGQMPAASALESEAARYEPDFTPVAEEILPLKTRIISISARNTPIKDVLYTVGENTGLNIVMETGVNPELPMTITLKEVAADEALDIIFSSVDYFYDLKGNVLVVRAMDTRLFEFQYPSISQAYSTNVGGDLLGAQEDVGDMQGSVTQGVILESEALWDTLENSLTGMVAGGTVDINKMSGIIMVTATRKNLKRIEKYLINFKEVMSRRVLIEARIVEVTLSDNLKYGIDWSFFDDISGGLLGAGDRILNIDMTNFNSVADLTADIPQEFRLAVTEKNFSAVLKALQQQGETEVLSNPRIGVLNGQTALLSVGTTQKYVSEIEVTRETDDNGDETVTYDITTDNILSGIMLGLAPSISDTGEVTMTITPIISDLKNNPDEPTEFGFSGETFSIFLPKIDLKELSTIIKIRDGEMIVIGGHIDRQEGVVETKVPFLGSIPFIGNLFKSYEKIEESTELVIMLKTTVEM